MKKILSVVLVLVLSFAIVPAIAVYASGEITVTIDGVPVEFEGQQPVIVSNRTLVPVRGVFEEMGFAVIWNNEARQAMLMNGRYIVVLTIGSDVFTVNGASHTLDVPAQIIGGRTMIPLRAVLERVGYNLDWDGNTQTVIITDLTANANQPRVATESSSIILPDRRLTDEERQTWIAEYNELGGASAFELEAVRLVNEIRIENNLSTVEMNVTLMMSARFYTQTMANLRTGLGHNMGPYGVEGASHGASANVAAAFGGRLGWNGGNGAAGHGTPQALVSGWMNSPGHRAYMLSPEHRFIGIGRFGGFSYLFLSYMAEPSYAPAAHEIPYLDTDILSLDLRYLGLTSDDIAPLKYMTNLRHLYLSNNHISDLTMLAGLTRLTRLRIYGNHASDLTPLAGLTNLEYLYLQRNHIRDLTPLSGLTNLTRLRAYRNNISDLTPLSNLTGLRHLHLAQNHISDLSPLTGLTNLEGYLNLYRNQISDLTPLSGMTGIYRLHLAYNQISDLSPLAGLTNLNYLYAQRNQISNLTPLAGLRNLRRAHFAYNYISDWSPVAHVGYVARGHQNTAREMPFLCPTLTSLNLSNMGLTNADIAPLRYMTNLRYLYLYGNQISDLSPLAGLTNLTGLRLQNNQISDLSPLSGLTNLRYVYLYRNQISDLTPLAGLTELRSLHLAYNQVSSIATLSGMVHLRSLNLHHNKINNMSMLGGLADLRYLNISGNQVSDLSPLSGLANLTRFRAYRNQISDLTPLAHLTGLRHLHLAQNQISDLSPISGLTNLEGYLHLYRNQISDLTPLSGMTGFYRLHLAYNQISDLTPLASLTDVRYLYLYRNQISDLTPLAGLTNLRRANLAYNQISDWSPVAHVEYVHRGSQR